MALSDARLRSIVNQLADPGTAHVAAHILRREAAERRVLIDDLVAIALAPPAPATPTARAASAPAFSVVDDDRLETSIGKRINSAAYGLRSEILAETDKAWLARTPNGAEAWLPKSQVELHGSDPSGRAILILPLWLARKRGLL
jgi:hypothetical protein